MSFKDSQKGSTRSTPHRPPMAGADMVSSNSANAGQTSSSSTKCTTPIDQLTQGTL